jgi:hypothetical protein
MSLITVVIVCIVIGVLLWLVEAYIPMNDTVKRILIGVVIIALVLWILDGYGLLDSIRNVGRSHRR